MIEFSFSIVPHCRNSSLFSVSVGTVNSCTFFLDRICIKLDLCHLLNVKNGIVVFDI